MRVGHLGPAGTFSEQAAREAAAGTGASLAAAPTIAAAVEALLGGAVDVAVLPIENSVEGGVNATVDALVAQDGMEICGEVVLRVAHCVVAREPVALDAVRRVLSHPQGHAQCARFLAERMPRAELVATATTADAVRRLADEPRGTAAIASRAAALAHGGVVLAEDVQDEPDNATRFACLARAGAPPFPPPRGGAAWKTSLLFAGTGDRAPGWLVRCLSELAFRGVNLVRIESRPARRALGHYVFLADCEGRAGDPAVAEAIAGLRGQCDRVRLLGSYPAAPPPRVS